MVHTGRTGVLEAINIATGYLGEADIESVLVGGIDSFQRHDLLMMLDDEKRVMATGIADGFAPGEGAGFLRITRNKAKALQNNQQTVYLSEPVLTQESSHLYSEAPCQSDALTAAISKALAGNSRLPVERIYSSQNGESFWAKELNVALFRNKKLLPENYAVEHPADCYGDLGAATGAVLIGLAAQHLFKQNENFSSLVCCSSDHANRASIIVGSLAQNKLSKNGAALAIKENVLA